MTYKNYLKLLRPKHYLKNILIFLPLVFSGNLFDAHNLMQALYAFAAFSLAASMVYVINDLRDRGLDAKHPTKRYRPIASGAISPTNAFVTACILLMASLFIQYSAGFPLSAIGLLGGYIAINLFYSMGLKNIPVVDVAILSLGFVIRVFYGGVALDIGVSKWLYLAILAFSFYMSLGKRRNELRSIGSNTRKVNKVYTKEFLDKNMYVFFALTIVYYSMWAVDMAQPHKKLIWTVPLVIATAMTYSLVVESEDSDGDPVNVLLGSTPLLLLAFVTILAMLGLVYV